MFLNSAVLCVLVLSVGDVQVFTCALIFPISVLILSHSTASGLANSDDARLDCLAWKGESQALIY